MMISNLTTILQQKWKMISAREVSPADKLRLELVHITRATAFKGVINFQNASQLPTGEGQLFIHQLKEPEKLSN